MAQSLSLWRHISSVSSLTGEEKFYLMKWHYNGKLLKVVLTNLVHVWMKEIIEEEAVRICRELNPLIECDDFSIVHKILSIIDELLQKKEMSTLFELNVTDDGNILWKFNSSMDGFAVRFQLFLTRESPEVFYEEVTCSLVSVANELVNRQESLFSILQKKDQEIAQFKLEGATLLRRNVVTKPFCRNDFVSVSHSKDTAPNVSNIKLAGILNTVPSKHGKLEDAVDENTIEISCQQSTRTSSSTDNVNDAILASKLENPVLSQVSSAIQPLQSDNASSCTLKIKKKKPKLNL